MSFIRKIRTFGSMVNRKFENVNYGGCAVYATMVIKELEKKGLVSAAFTCGWDHDRRNIATARSNIKQTIRLQKFQWIFGRKTEFLFTMLV